jgi:penicillin-binding protein 1A
MKMKIKFKINRSNLIKAAYVLTGIFFLSLFGVIGILTYFTSGLPKIEALSDYHPILQSQILSKDGTILAEFGSEKREIVDMKDVPRFVVNAFLSAEDDSFYQHTGVDYGGIARAMLVNLKAGKVVQGGSTITQQVAKSFYLSKERSIARKIKDVLLAHRIEKKLSKEEILYLYLNQVYLGGGYYGVKSAFKGYFGKELFESTLAEAAMVAGLLVAPGRYSPYVNPKFAKKRQSYVLKRMLGTGKITQQEYQAAMDEKIKYQLKKKNELKAPYFSDWVRQKVIAELGERTLNEEGLRIQTTLDWVLQETAEKETLKGVKELDKRQGFIGPITHKDEARIREFELEFRKNLLIEKSDFFIIGKDFEKEYQLDFDEKNYLVTKENFDSKKEQFKGYLPGNLKEDQLLDHLDINGSYEAIVTKVDDREGLIYVSLGGLTGIIPRQYFQWARKREIFEERSYGPPLSNPSQILTPGDVVLVEVLRKNDSILPYLNKNIELLKGESYVLCQLDQYPIVQGALISMIPQTGEIVSMVGGTDFYKSQFNRSIQSLRQPGSCFKPFLYAAALENGFTPASIIIDSPEALSGVDEQLKWKPSNYDGKFKGQITFRTALEESRNIPSIRIANTLGIRKIEEFINRLQLNAQTQHDLSIALGSFGVSLLDIVKTYGIFPNGGKLVWPKAITSIKDREGKDISINFEMMEKKPPVEKKVVVEGEEPNPFLANLTAERVYDSRLSYLMTNLLKGVILNGTGQGAKGAGTYIGGKTGTTNNYVDAWFIGFNPTLVTGVWTGFDDNKTLGYGETGARAALPTWREYMKEGIKRYGERDFNVPSGIINVLIEKETGSLATSRGKTAMMEAFVQGFEPKEGGGSKPKTDEESTSNIFDEDEYFNVQ